MKNLPTKISYYIEYQECDYMSRYRIAPLLSKMSDIATKNAIEVKLWTPELKEKYGWVIVKQTLRMKRPIKMEELVTLSTRAKENKRIQFGRTYQIEIDGKEIAGAYSVWTMIDLKKRRIIRPCQAGIEDLEFEEYECMVDQYTPISHDIETTKVHTRQVLYNDVDVNQHMNNTRYIEWALDLLPYEIFQTHFVEELNMHYLKEIAPLQNVDLYYGMKDDSFLIQFMVEGETCFELSGKLKKDDI